MEIEKEIVQSKFENSYQKAIINIVFTQSWLMSNMRQILEPYDITPQQFNVLRILRGQYPKPATLNLVKERIIDKMSDVSRIVDRLVKKDIIERKVCKSDRRAVDLLITQKGLDLLSNITIEKMQGFVGNNLTDNELEKLNELLDKLRG
ncbi:MarR family winged helix-turn-helix transcriptional regulator [Solitalea canadensis]|uniref:Transcriptional regulator n=1 Tax=Solitalea canadensis (strain ATCC 29591 / DSM 3403 / JCM 21819 / LMG 8368 / NBRC 15130 / NCIMB 12057 / USAM 9D) TaxID=929556 RepID=H8KRA8_SOLCM|nr:MarR family transcriptional regulator [Solitalea canadensis]AFD07375.1 transcriptional regulator [Solitalea canadensis DSM 3403]